jgi:hypothetical protein
VFWTWFRGEQKASFCCSLIQSHWFSLVDSVATQSSQPQVCFSVLSFLQCNKSSAIRKCWKWMRKLVLFGAFAFGTVIGRDWNCCCCKNYWLWFKPSAQMSPGLRNFLWPAFDFDAKWIFTHIFTDQLQPFLLELLHNQQGYINCSWWPLIGLLRLYNLICSCMLSLSLVLFDLLKKIWLILWSCSSLKL